MLISSLSTDKKSASLSGFLRCSVKWTRGLLIFSFRHGRTKNLQNSYLMSTLCISFRRQQPGPRVFSLSVCCDLNLNALDYRILFLQAIDWLSRDIDEIRRAGQAQGRKKRAVLLALGRKSRVAGYGKTLLKITSIKDINSNEENIAALVAPVLRSSVGMDKVFAEDLEKPLSALAENHQRFIHLKSELDLFADRVAKGNYRSLLLKLRHADYPVTAAEILELKQSAHIAGLAVGDASAETFYDKQVNQAIVLVAEYPFLHRSWTLLLDTEAIIGVLCWSLGKSNPRYPSLFRLINEIKEQVPGTTKRNFIKDFREIRRAAEQEPRVNGSLVEDVE